MKRILVLCITAIMFTTLVACSTNEESTVETPTPDVSATPETVEKTKPEQLVTEDISDYSGADAYANGGDHTDSMYFVNPDFYNMESTDTLTILPNFKTMQQTAEWSCGAASVFMYLNHIGITEYSEWDLAVLGNVSVDEDTPDAQPGSANNFHEYGASVEKMVNMVSTIEGVEVIETSYIAEVSDDMLLSEEDGVTGNEVGNLPGTFSSNALYASENSATTEAWVDDAKDSYFVTWLTNHIKEGNGILVEWVDWDGHWQVVIGYDTMGTPSIGDDIIIFADPYDTSDHWQDGYYYYPAERFFYMWEDRNVAPKPYQIQPYIVLGSTK